MSHRTRHALPVASHKGQAVRRVRGGQVYLQNALLDGEPIVDPHRLSVIVVGSSYLKSVAEGTDDIAKGRIASQSSTLDERVAARANDGFAQPWLYFESVSCTLVEAEPWWRVELGGLHLVAKIEIVSAQRGTTSLVVMEGDRELQLHNVSVSLLRAAAKAWTHRIPTLSPQHTIWLEPAVLGTAVEVRRLERSQLCLAEVLVFPTQ